MILATILVLTLRQNIDPYLHFAEFLNGGKALACSSDGSSDTIQILPNGPKRKLELDVRFFHVSPESKLCIIGDNTIAQVIELKKLQIVWSGKAKAAWFEGNVPVVGTSNSGTAKTSHGVLRQKKLGSVPGDLICVSSNGLVQVATKEQGKYGLTRKLFIRDRRKSQIWHDVAHVEERSGGGRGSKVITQGSEVWILLSEGATDLGLGEIYKFSNGMWIDVLKRKGLPPGYWFCNNIFRHDNGVAAILYRFNVNEQRSWYFVPNVNSTTMHLLKHGVTVDAISKDGKSAIYFHEREQKWTIGKLARLTADSR